MRQVRVLFILLLVTLLQSPLKADDNVFVTEAPDAVVAGQRFRLSYTINTHDIEDLQTPDIKGFEVLFGPQQSQQSSTQIINGKMTSNKSITFTYVLVGKKPGKYTIPGATIVANGKKVRSNNLSITVLPPDEEGKEGESSNGISSKDMFVRPIVNKKSLYEQEPLLLTYKLYTTEANINPRNIKFPDFKGFQSKEIEKRNITLSREHYKGRNYYTAELAQYVLFPQQYGELTINSAEFDFIVNKRNANVDPFDAFFNNSSSMVRIEKDLVTPECKINVKQLPTKPDNYCGGVGDFTIDASINSNEVKTNDAITYKLVISGKGNLNLISAPEIEFPEDFEVYDPKTEYQTRLTTSGVEGNMVVEYLIIPRIKGEYTIPALSLSYFDIKAKKYKNLTTEAFTINVAKGKGDASQVVANFTNKEKVKMLGQDIRFINQKSAKIKPRGEHFYKSTLFYTLLWLPVIAFIILLVIYRKQVAENSNVVKMRRKKANKVAIKRMKKAKDYLNKNCEAEFYEEVIKALWGYISDKLNMPLSELSKDNIAENLRQIQVNEELISDLISILNVCEFARFAPSKKNNAMDNLYQSVIDAISNMENNIKH